MVRLVHERVLLIGDTQRDVQSALLQAVPGAQVVSVPTMFDGIAELSSGSYTTVLAAAEPVERRPEAAVRTLRELAGDGRIILFGHPTLELLSRKMLEFGADDYMITPASPGELQQMLGTPSLRVTPAAPPSEDSGEATKAPETPSWLSTVSTIPFADLVLDAQLQHPQDAPAAAVRHLNALIAPVARLAYARVGGPAPAAEEGRVLISHPVRANNEDAGLLHLTLPAGEDEARARHTLSQFAHLIGKIEALQDRHNRVQKLAITDELTGVYNARYFRHFLSRIIERARTMRFPVSLLLFDIDDFKKYNDHYGHVTGDEILRQTAALMRRCTRDHDLVARIGGDEFAVVFWDKEGPRMPRDPKPGVISRPPQTPLQIFERFRGMLSSEEFPSLGLTGQGVLTVSAGLAVYPYEAQDAASLVSAADRALMQGAKKNGKNSVFLVGTDDPTHPPEAPRQ